MKILKAIALAAISLAAAPSWSQSFDCSKAGNPTEQAICANEKLAGDDESLNYLYRAARDSGLVNKAQLQADQRAWVRERNKCGSNVACIAKQYEAREGSMCDVNAPEGQHPCYKNKDEAWEAAQSAGAGTASQPTTFDEFAAEMSSKSGGFLAASPKVQPDGALYHLHGRIAIPADGKTEFMAMLTPSEDNEPLANALRKARGGAPVSHFYVVVPKWLQSAYLEYAQVNGGFDLIGKYTANVGYQTVAGQQKIAPVFVAERIFFWGSKIYPFNKKVASKPPAAPKGAHQTTSADLGE